MKPATITRGLIINAPKLFANAAFVEWLNSGRSLTWHDSGEPGEWSDALVLVPPDLSAAAQAGLESEGIPADLAFLLIDACSSYGLEGQSTPIPVRLTNLEGEARVTPTTNLVIHAPEWLDNAQLKAALRANPLTMNRRDGDKLLDVVAWVDPGLSGEGSDTHLPESIWDELVQACRDHKLGGDGLPHIGVRITRDAPPIDPELSRAAKAYYDELQTSYDVMSQSHVTRRGIIRRFGEEALEAALKPYFAAEDEKRRQRNWEVVRDFYAASDMTPAPDHPERPADVAPPYNLKELSSLASFAERKRYCDARFKVIATGTGRRVYDMGNGQALKLAINSKGIAQNGPEADFGLGQMYSEVLNPPLDCDEDDAWVVSKKLEKVTQKDLEAHYGVKWPDMLSYFKQATQYFVLRRGPMPDLPAHKDGAEFEERLEDLGRLLADIDLVPDDFAAKTAFGKDPDTGDIRIIDYGLTRDVWLEHYRNKGNDHSPSL